MRYAILSDIHANLEALERVLQDARAQGIDQIICLGDVVGYGPQPDATVSRVHEVCAVTLAGNHDDAVSGRGDASQFIDLAGDAIVRHRAALSPDALAWLRSLPWTCELEGAVCAHGDLCDPPKFYYIEDEADATANFNTTTARLIFVGHTHTPEIFLTGQSGAVYQIEPQDFTLEDGKRYIVNPGSVGYPREKDGHCFSSYVIYDATEGTICYRFLPFSVASVMQRGQTPPKIKRGLLAVGALAIGLLCAVLAWWFTPKVEIEVTDDPALIVEQRTLTPAAGDRLFRANLELEKDSAPLQVKISFLSDSNAVLSAPARTVKESFTKKFPLPKDTAKVELTLLRLTPEADIQIKSFAPATSVK